MSKDIKEDKDKRTVIENVLEYLRAASAFIEDPEDPQSILIIKALRDLSGAVKNDVEPVRAKKIEKLEELLRIYSKVPSSIIKRKMKIIVGNL